MSTRKSRILEFAVIFLMMYVVTEFALRTVFPKQFGRTPPPGIEFTAQDTTVRGGHAPVLVVKNHTEQEFVLKDTCPHPPVKVFYVQGGGEGSGSLLPRDSTETATPCIPVANVAAGDEAQLSLAPWKYSVFGEYGTYEVRLNPTLTTRFSIHPPGVMVQLFRAIITKPFLNFLIFVASVLPDHNLGIAIIVLTLVVKLLLFFPTQHALEGQKKMQALQPKLADIKKKYAGNAQKQHEETVKLWKQEGVNPFQSILPILLQFPILIGLFFVIRDGSVLELSREFVYPAYAHLPWGFSHSFLGLDLTKPNLLIMPPLLMVLQFVQMKLSFAIAKRKKAAERALDQAKKTDDAQSSQEMQQKIMQYVFPFMIGFFALQFPAAVSLYWGVSTAFAIGQQVVVNRKTIR